MIGKWSLIPPVDQYRLSMGFLVGEGKSSNL
jgi:hypothetical protein